MKTFRINGVAYRPATLQEIAKGLAFWTGNLFVVRSCSHFGLLPSICESSVCHTVSSDECDECKHSSEFDCREV